MKRVENEKQEKFSQEIDWYGTIGLPAQRAKHD